MLEFAGDKVAVVSCQTRRVERRPPYALSFRFLLSLERVASAKCLSRYMIAVLLHGELSCPMQIPRALLHFFSIPCILVKLISFAIICIIGSVLSYFALWLVENGEENNCEGHGQWARDDRPCHFGFGACVFVLPSRSAALELV